MPATILVTGATGGLGRAVIDTLLQTVPADRIAALVRNPDKASDLWDQGVSVRIGTYDDPASLDAALGGIETVLLVSGTDEGNRVRQHRNVIEAAQRAGVRLLAYTSRNLRDPETLENALMTEHFRTEDDVRASGLSYAVFRNALYMDAIPRFVGGDRVFETGIALPAGDGRVAYALRSEQGEAIARVLATPLPPGQAVESRTYRLTGARAHSFADVADALTRLSGRPVAYTDVDEATFSDRMAANGLPAETVRRIVGFVVDIRNGQEEETTSDLADLLGREPAGLDAGLPSLFSV